MICESPLFIRPHSKVVLSKAIHNDSEFLANHSVMDYSLLVGIDEVNFELVVGIIGKQIYVLERYFTLFLFFIDIFIYIYGLI